MRSDKQLMTSEDLLPVVMEGGGEAELRMFFFVYVWGEELIEEKALWFSSSCYLKASIL